MTDRPSSVSGDAESCSCSETHVAPVDRSEVCPSNEPVCSTLHTNREQRGALNMSRRRHSLQRFTEKQKTRPCHFDLTINLAEVPEKVQYRQDVDEDGFTIGHIFRTLTTPTVYSPVYLALKTALICCLPLSILAFSPGIQDRFKAGSLFAVIGTQYTKLYLGEQIATCIMLWQSAVWMMIYGTIMNCLGTARHEGAWWGMTFLGVVLVAFFPKQLRGKRFLMSYTVIIMQMQRMPGGGTTDHPANVAGNIMMGLCFSLLQALLPFPMLMTRKTDRIFSNAWVEVGNIVTSLCDAVGSGRAVTGALVASETACDELLQTIDSIPGLLFLCSYEPFEGSLNNQLRSQRLTLLRRMLMLLHATTTAARQVSLMLTPETRMSGEALKRILQGPLQDFIVSLRDTLKQMGNTLQPVETVAQCNVRALGAAKERLIVALRACCVSNNQRAADITEAPAFYSLLYFYLLLSLLAEELHTFSEQMANFNPSDYKSTWQSFMDFFFWDYWNDVVRIPMRLLLLTKEDRRALKNGVKLACAYSVATAFTMKLNEGHEEDTYYLGMSILQGIGYPTVAESITIGVQRIAGLAFALSIGYLAQWKTSSFSEAIAVLVIGVFVAVCFKSNKRYMQVAWYTSSVSIAAYGIAINRNMMVSRVVDNCFAVMAYFLICSFMFPMDPTRILWNTRAKVAKQMADATTLLASVVLLPVDQEHLDIASARMKLVKEYVKKLGNLLRDENGWITLASEEPVAVGKPFPKNAVTSTHTLLCHTLAGLEMWLLGAQLLHRPRSDPPHPLVLRMIAVIKPIIHDLEIISRAIFQDLIDAMQAPFEWSQERLLEHFRDFGDIKVRLDYTFQELHKDILAAQIEKVNDSFSNDYVLNSGDKLLQNRSFIGTAVITAEPENMRSVNDYGALYDVKNPSYTNAVERWRYPASAAPTDESLPVDETAVHYDRYDVNTSFGGYHATFSYRALADDLPIDVDVTAATIIVTSVSTIVNSLELMSPHIHDVNRFQRSRTVKEKFDIFDAYMCRRSS